MVGPISIHFNDLATRTRTANPPSVPILKMMKSLLSLPRLGSPKNGVVNREEASRLMYTHVTFQRKTSLNLRWIDFAGIISAGFWASVETIGGKTSYSMGCRRSSTGSELLGNAGVVIKMRNLDG